MNKINNTPTIALLSIYRTYENDILTNKYSIITDGLVRGETEEYEHRLWLDYNVNNSMANRELKAKVYAKAMIVTKPLNEIHSIEDLVRLSNEVNSGNTYEGVDFILTRWNSRKIWFA